MSEKRFTSNKRWIAEGTIVDICDNGKVIMQVFDDDNIQDVVDFLNEQQTTTSELEEEKEYWKSKAMTLLMQVRRLTPRMTDKEVIEFNKELDDEKNK